MSTHLLVGKDCASRPARAGARHGPRPRPPPGPSGLSKAGGRRRKSLERKSRRSLCLNWSTRHVCRGPLGSRDSGNAPWGRRPPSSQPLHPPGGQLGPRGLGPERAGPAPGCGAAPPRCGPWSPKASSAFSAQGPSEPPQGRGREGTCFENELRKKVLESRKDSKKEDRLCLVAWQPGLQWRGKVGKRRERGTGRHGGQGGGQGPASVSKWPLRNAAAEAGCYGPGGTRRPVPQLPASPLGNAAMAISSILQETTFL